MKKYQIKSKRTGRVKQYACWSSITINVSTSRNPLVYGYQIVPHLSVSINSTVSTGKSKLSSNKYTVFHALTREPITQLGRIFVPFHKHLCSHFKRIFVPVQTHLCSLSNAIATHRTCIVIAFGLRVEVDGRVNRGERVHLSGNCHLLLMQLSWHTRLRNHSTHLLWTEMVNRDKNKDVCTTKSVA